MTAAEFDAYLADVRAYVAAQLAVLAQVDWSALAPHERADLEHLRASLVELQATMSDEFIAAELAATEHAGRGLAPAELAGLLRPQ